MSVCLIFPASAVEIVPYKNGDVMSIKNSTLKDMEKIGHGLS
jgi:hypothetical protein